MAEEQLQPGVGQQQQADGQQQPDIEQPERAQELLPQGPAGPGGNGENGQPQGPKRPLLIQQQAQVHAIMHCVIPNCVYVTDPRYDGL